MNGLNDWGMFGEDGARGTVIGKGREAEAVAYENQSAGHRRKESWTQPASTSTRAEYEVYRGREGYGRRAGDGALMLVGRGRGGGNGGRGPPGVGPVNFRAPLLARAWQRVELGISSRLEKKE